jgi:hypothetical protein
VRDGAFVEQVTIVGEATEDPEWAVIPEQDADGIPACRAWLPSHTAIRSTRTTVQSPSSLRSDRPRDGILSRRSPPARFPGERTGKEIDEQPVHEQEGFDMRPSNQHRQGDVLLIEVGHQLLLSVSLDPALGWARRPSLRAPSGGPRRLGRQPLRAAAFPVHP